MNIDFSFSSLQFSCHMILDVIKFSYSSIGMKKNYPLDLLDTTNYMHSKPIEVPASKATSHTNFMNSLSQHMAHPTKGDLIAVKSYNTL